MSHSLESSLASGPAGRGGAAFWAALAVIVLAFVCSPAQALASPASDFKAGWTAFHKLADNPAKAKLREPWLQVGRRFESAFRADTDGPYAPKSLYYLGRVYEELGTRSGLRNDFLSAVDYYQRQATTFPKHDWTDDALYRKAVLYLKHLNERDLAYVDLLLVVNDHPKGDMRGRAKALLQKLDKAQPPNPSKVAVRKEQAAKPSARPAGPDSEVSLSEIRHFSSGDYTRVVLQLSGKAGYTTNLVKPGHGQPHRLAIDLSGAKLDPFVPKSVSIDDGLLEGVRAAQYTRDTTRVVLDFHDLHRHHVFSIENPYRVVVDVFSDSDSKPATVAKASKPGSSAKAAPRGRPNTKDAADLVEQLGLTVKTVMIDAGHGGKDPGALAYGVREKNITLALAKKVGARLKKKGLKVLYTRTNDTFVSLEKRTALANAQKADLFVSIHVNASRNKKLHGLETYSLNMAKTKNAKRVAARENAVSEKAISDLQLIITEFMLNSKVRESSDLAASMQASVLKSVKRAYPLQDHGTREAPFYVLMGARMPAVLVEVGYLTNRTEAKRLKNSHYQNHLADGIADGVWAYKKKIEAYASL